jgi:hypothetical protein
MGAPLTRGQTLIIGIGMGFLLGIAVVGITAANLCENRKRDIRATITQTVETAKNRVSRKCDEIMADAMKQCGEATKAQFEEGYRRGVSQTILHVKLVHDEPTEAWIAGMIAAAKLPLDEWRKRMRELEPLGAWGESPELERVQPSPTPTASPSPSPAATPSAEIQPGTP